MYFFFLNLLLLSECFSVHCTADLNRVITVVTVLLSLHSSCLHWNLRSEILHDSLDVIILKYILHLQLFYVQYNWRTTNWSEFKIPFFFYPLNRGFYTLFKGTVIHPPPQLPPLQERERCSLHKWLPFFFLVRGKWVCFLFTHTHTHTCKELVSVWARPQSRRFDNGF